MGHKSTAGDDDSSGGSSCNMSSYMLSSAYFSPGSRRCKRGGGREGCQWDSVTHGSEPKGRNELEGSKVEDGSADVLIAWN